MMQPVPETGGDAEHLAGSAQLSHEAYIIMLKEEVTQGSFTGPELLLRMSAKLATRVPQPTVASAPPAASQQAKLHPPRGTPAAAPGAGGCDASRVGQRPAPKMVSLESITGATAAILKSAERGRKEGRVQLLDAHRAGEDDSGAATPV